MKRVLTVLLLVVLGVNAVSPAFAGRRVIVRRGPGRRSIVVVHRGWPLRRAPRAVIVHPMRGVVRVSPGVFIAPAVFTGVLVTAESTPTRDVIVWEDGETLVKADNWTEFTLNCDTRGKQLWLEVPAGKVQIDWAEVVFENGDAQVVDFNEKTLGPGLYSLLDFRDGRKVDHVRVVARARTDEAKVILSMQKE